MSLINADSLSLEDKIGQLFFIGIPGDTVDAQTERLLAEIRPGGICLFARNIREPVQTRALLDRIRGSITVEPFLSLDQEGGLVDRLRRVLAPMPAANRLLTSTDAARAAEIIAEATRLLGFNMDFAPVVDVVTAERAAFSNGLHSRAFGANADDVVELAGEFLRSLQANGCLGCLKHFPGLGASKVDSHEELPAVSISEDELFATDLLPYRELFHTDMVSAVMVAHAVYPAHHLQEVDQNGKLLPSSLSPGIVTKLLRKELNFNGLVLTDDLEMGAIAKNYGIGEASVMAILAGEDMVSICAGVDSINEAHAAILGSVRAGRISEGRIGESLERIARVKSKLHSPLDLDLDRLNALKDEVGDLIGRLN